MAAIVTGVLGVGYLVGVLRYVVSSFLQAGRVLDSLLNSTGMISERYLLFGRQYRGTVKGRNVEIYFVPSRALWPTQLNIYVTADLGTRMAIGWQKPMLDCSNCARLEMLGEEMKELKVYAHEVGDAEWLQVDQASREALVRLMYEQRNYGFSEVYLQPKRVWLRAHPQGMTVDLFQRWLMNVLALAEACEKALDPSR